MTESTPRRSFLGNAITTAAGLLAVPGVAAASGSLPAAPDEAWLEGLMGKHRQYFDVAAAGPTGFARVANYLDVYAEAYALKDTDLNAVFGAHGSATSLLLNDAMWNRFELGRRSGIDDPSTRAPARRNPFATGALSVARLQERGVRFIVCMRSIRRLSGELAAGAPGMTAEQIRGELLGNLLPGVTAVPAAIVATNRAQEAGLTYVYIG